MSPSAYEVLPVLETGSLELHGLLPYSSNHAFIASACLGDREVRCVYKPRRGERPLWDFEHGTLAAREVASYLVSEAGGVGFVPPTVLRADGPMGVGALQQFIEHDPERHYFNLVDERRGDFPSLVAFDIVINNADRKAGHIVEDAAGKLWGFDHGLTFNTEDKLRTVAWEFAGDPIPKEVEAQLEMVTNDLVDPGGLGGDLGALLAPGEVAATLLRAERLLGAGAFPIPESQYRLPWPLV